MDAAETDHSPIWWQDTTSDSTTHVLRWDLHGMSPRHPVSDNAGNRALSTPADHNPHPYALSNTPKILPFRSDQLLQVFKDSDRYTSASPASSASTALAWTGYSQRRSARLMPMRSSRSPITMNRI